MKTEIKMRLISLPGFESLCRFLTRRHVRAFMYHRFHDGTGDETRGIDSGTLEAQIRLIRQHHTVMTPDEHLAAVQGEHTGYCPVVVTIDDGYADFHDIAYPLFRDEKIPAMLFVTTGFVSGSMWFWWEQLAYVLDHGPREKSNLDFEEETFTLDLTSPEKRNLTWHVLADRCRFLADGRKNSLIARLADQLEVTLPATAPRHLAAVSWDQVRQMAQGGILFGAHTVNHPILSRVDPETALQEIAGSREHLEKELARPVEWFCYPQGGPADFNDEVKDMVSRHFRGCYLSYQNMDGDGDCYTLPRYGVPGDPGEFRWTLCGAEFIVMKVKKILGLKTGVADSYWTGSTGSSHDPQ